MTAVGTEGWAHTHVERVRFGDLDAMRHLNNVVFLRYFESARIAYIGQLLERNPVHPEGGFGLIFAQCHIDYRSPGQFDEEVAVRVRPTDVGTKSFRLEFDMRAGDRLLAEGHGVLVGYDYETATTVALPDALKTRLATPIG
jgi:acyl-CoA thioester hydrolase